MFSETCLDDDLSFFFLFLLFRPCYIFSPVSKAKAAVSRPVPKLPEGIHQNGPCPVSQSIEGGTELQDVVGGLRTEPHMHFSEWEIFSFWRWKRR